MVAAIEAHLEGRSRSDAPEGAWPLEVTFDPSKIARGRKISLSDCRNGWVAVVDASETVEPDLALSLSRELRTRVLVAQVSEVAGSAGVALLDGGVARGGPTRGDLEGSTGVVMAVLAKAGVPFSLVLFRETVGHMVAGWRTISRRPQAG